MITPLGYGPGMSARRVLIVPGLAVRGYAESAVGALGVAGYDASLLTPPSWRGADCDLDAYGRRLGREIDGGDQSIAALVGLSVGTQAAAVAAAVTSKIERLILVSPTVDSVLRSRPRLLAAWLFRGEPGGPSLLYEQIPDWARAGPTRIFRGFNSALEVDLEEIIPRIAAEITLVHGELDPITSHSYVMRVAAAHGCRLELVPNGPHSWPTDDATGFVDLLDRMCDV